MLTVRGRKRTARVQQRGPRTDVNFSLLKKCAVKEKGCAGMVAGRRQRLSCEHHRSAGRQVQRGAHLETSIRR